jgi:hypothetical protein
VTAIATPLADDGLVVSNVVEAFEGARAAVLHAEGLFRLDVVVVPDNVRVVVRNLSPGPLAFAPDGYPRAVEVQGDDPAELALRPGHHQVAFTLGEDGDAVDVRVVLGTLRALVRGTVQITGQAIVTRAA